MPLAEYDAAGAARILRPKVEGARALAGGIAALGRPPGFVLFASSLSGVLGGPGFVAYAAANRAMEAIAGPRCLSVALDGLRFPEDGGGDGPAAAPLPVEAALDAIEAALAAGLTGRVLVTGGRLAERFARWAEGRSREPARAAPQRAWEPPPGGGTEALVAAAWAEALGRPPARDEDFFAMGGDSLLAIQIVARLREATGLALTLGLVLDARTVERTVAILDALKLAAATPNQDAAAPAEAFEEGEL
jgi:acyl carrier protein